MWPFTKSKKQLVIEQLQRDNAALTNGINELRRHNADILNRYEQSAEAYQELAGRMRQTLTPEFFASVFKDVAEEDKISGGKLEMYTPDLAHGLYGSEQDDTFDPRDEGQKEA